MSDRYLSLVNSPVGSAVASRVGLPRPAVLRRYEPGEPLLPGPVLLGAAPGETTKATAALRKTVTAAGAEVASIGEANPTFDEVFATLVEREQAAAADADVAADTPAVA